MRKTRRILVLALILALVCVSVSSIVFSPLVSATSGNLVGTSTAATATQYPNQRKAFYAAGLHWVWYSDGTNLVYKTSADGVTWSNATTIGATSYGHQSSVVFDGTYIHYARYASYVTYYRRGTPLDNGSIDWSAVEQTVYSVSSTDYYFSPVLAVDSGGYAWIGDWHRPDYYPFIFKNANNNGTWSTAVNFPYKLSTTSDGTWRVSVVSLTAGKVYVIYSRTGVAGYGRLWDGSSWGSEENAIADAELGYGHSAVADSNDNIYLVYLNDALATGIMYTSRNAITGLWSTEVTVQANATAAMIPVLSIDNATGNLYCFWENTSNYIYYKKCVSGTWDTSATQWVDETTDTFKTGDLLSCSYRAYDYKIGVEYTTKTASPYNVKYAFLSLALPPQEYTENLSQNIAMSTASLRGSEYLKSITQSFSLTAIVATASSFVIALIQSFSLLGVAGVGKEVGESLSQSFSYSIGKVVGSEYSTNLSQSFLITVSPTSNREAGISLSQLFSYTAQVDFNKEIGIALDQTFSFSTTVTCEIEFGVALVQTFSLLGAIGAGKEVGESLNQPLSFTNTNVISSERSANLSQSFSYTAQIDFNKEVGISLEQSFSFTVTVTESSEFGVALAETFSFVGLVGVAKEIEEDLMQSVSFSTSVEIAIERYNVEYSESIDQAISFTDLEVNNEEIGISLQQSFSFTYSTVSNNETGVLLEQSFSFTDSITSNIEIGILLNQPFSITALIPSFSISIYPANTSVEQGKWTTATVTVTGINGYGLTISLTASGQPSGVLVIFSPSDGIPSFSSTMMIAVGSSAATGTYTITIKGVGTDGMVNTSTFALTITAPSAPEEIVTVAAPSPPLFTMVGFSLPAFQVLGNVIPLWFPVVIVGVYGWAKKRKIIVAGCAFMLVAIWVFGARLTNVLLPSPLTPSTAALLTPVFSAFGKLVPLWVPIAVVAMWGWAKGKKEVALACLGMLIFLFLFGARIL